MFRPRTPFAPGRSPYWHHITLAQLQRVKEWREAQRGTHPLECQLWEAVLTAWLMRPRARLALKLMILYLPPLYSSNTQLTTRALSALRSTALKYSSLARLMTTGVASAAARSLR